MTTTRWCASGAALALGLLGGCGDDGGEGEAAAPAAGTASTEFCDAALAFENAPEPDIDFESASQDELAAATSAYAEDTLRPLVERLRSSAPAEIAHVADAVAAAVDDVAATGGFTPFEDPGFAAAAAEGEAFTEEACGWSRLAVTAVDFGFEGLPERIDAGVVRFTFANEGTEPHELAVFRKDDGVAHSLDELLALPEGEVEELVTFVAQVFSEPGDHGASVVADLQPGEYVAICFVPLGGEGGPPHFSEGMAAEFTVDRDD